MLKHALELAQRDQPSSADHHRCDFAAPDFSANGFLVEAPSLCDLRGSEVLIILSLDGRARGRRFSAPLSGGSARRWFASTKIRFHGWIELTEAGAGAADAAFGTNPTARGGYADGKQLGQGFRSIYAKSLDGRPLGG